MIAKRVRKLRKTKSLTQTEFAKKIGVSLRAIQMWEKGEVDVRDATLHLIESTFGVSPLWLREGVGEMFAENNLRIDDELGHSFSNEDIKILNALQSDFISKEDKEYIIKYIDERRELFELRRGKGKG